MSAAPSPIPIARKNSDSREKTENALITLTPAQVLAITNKSEASGVTKVNAFAMRINDIEGLSEFKNLTVLSLSSNCISDLSTIQNCTSLIEIYSRKNNIADLKQVVYLKSLPRLKVLFLADNVCCADPEYRPKVLRLLPGLNTLDVDNVTDTERDAVLHRPSPTVIRFENEALEFGTNTSSDHRRKDMKDTTILFKDLKWDKESVEETGPAGNSIKQNSAEVAAAKVYVNSRNESGANSKSEMTSVNVFNAIKFLLAELRDEDVQRLRDMCDALLHRPVPEGKI